MPFAAQIPSFGVPVYAATKAAVANFTAGMGVTSSS